MTREDLRCSARPGARARPVACALLLLLAGCQAGGARHARPERHAPREAPYDVEHYAIDLALDPAARAIEATCTLRLWATAGALDEVRLDLVGLEVRGVRDARGRELAWRQGPETLVVELAQPLARGDFAELSIAYGGRPERGLWFTDVEQGLPTQVFTQGQCDDARCWFPCFDEPSDRATSELRVRLPAGWRALAAGERVERVDHGDGTASELWRMHVAHPPYLTTLVAGELTAIEERHGDVPLVYLVDPELSAAAPGAFAVTGEALDFLEGLTGRRYPYAKYGQACVAGFPFGGMENVSATTLTDTVLRDERGARDHDPTDLIVHEAAHQWFGDLLTCADWSHVWLNEGFATYAALLFLEARGEVDEFRVRLRDAQAAYVAGDTGNTRRPIVHDVYVDPFDLFFGGHAYSGGASRLHLLRRRLGDEAFFAGLRRYVAESQGRSVVTDDLRRALEEVSGIDLGGFFEQWLYGGGYPELEWGWSFEDGRVRLDVAQVQDPEHAPAVFELHTEVELRLGSGSQIERVVLDRRRQRLEFEVPERPLWVHLDRGGSIPKAERVERPLDEWLAIAGLDEDVNARRDAVAVIGPAARAAAGAQRQGLALALVERLLEDPSRHVRRLAAQELAGLRLPTVVQALRAAAESDPEAIVRVAALDALAPPEPDAGLAAFARAQFEAGHSWDTMGAAARLFAAAAPDEAEAFLLEAAELRAPHGELAAHLFAALGRLGTEAALAALRRAFRDEELPVLARASAALALGPHARRRSAIAFELAELLPATPHYHLQTALIEALALARDPRTLPELEAFHARVDDARQRRAIERILREPWARP